MAILQAELYRRDYPSRTALFGAYPQDEEVMPFVPVRLILSGFNGRDRAFGHWLCLRFCSANFSCAVILQIPVHGEFIKSRGDRRLVKAAAVLPPPIRDKAHQLFASVDTRFWQPSLQSGMTTIAVEIVSEREKLCLQVGRGPE